jgi:hypothetical protein
LWQTHFSRALWAIPTKPMKILQLLLLTLFFCSCNDKEVHQEFYPTGELQAEYETRNGIRDGYFRYYNKDGTIHSEYSNEDGKKNGLAIKYYSSGVIERKGLIKDNQLIWDELYDHNGIILNKNQGIQTTYYTYFSNKDISKIEYTTDVYDNINTDSLLYVVLDSGYIYTKNPHQKAIRFINQEDRYTVENLLSKNEIIDSVRSWNQIKHLKNTILGPDSTDTGYIPTIHKE